MSIVNIGLRECVYTPSSKIDFLYSFQLILKVTKKKKKKKKKKSTESLCYTSNMETTFYKIVFSCTAGSQNNIVSYGLFYNQGTSSKNYIAALFICRSLLGFQSAFAKTLIRVRSTYSNKEKVRINQRFKKICSFVMILPKIAVSFGFSQILCSSITWNKHKE